MGIGERTRHGLRCALLLVIGCGGGGQLGPDDPGSTSSGAAYNVADKPVASGAGSRAASGVAMRCGSSCTADVAAGHSSFAAARYADAYEAFKCANTAEAAFGAGMSKLLNAFESKAADQVMSDLGQSHVPASALLGPDSYMSRAGKRWNGSGELSLRGARILDVTFAKARAAYDDEELEAETVQDGTRVRAWVWLSQSMATGVLPITYNCANGGVRNGSAPDLTITLVDGDQKLECGIPYSLPTGCVPSGGNVTIAAGGFEVGELVRYELNEVRLECRPTEDGDSTGVSGDSTGTGLPPGMIISATGFLEATLTDHVDISDLHPIFDGVSPAQVSTSVSLAQFVEHAAPIADDLAQAGCLFDVAGEGSGTVFSLPGVSYAGDDLPLTAGDARILGSFATSGAALIQLARAFPIDVSLHEIACRYGSDDDTDNTACPSETVFIDHFNAAVAKVSVRKEPLDAARFLTELGLRRFDRGATALDEASVFKRDARSEAGWMLAQEFVRAAVVSMQRGTTALPRVTPQITFDLRSFFAAPPDPRAIHMPLVKTTQECDAPDDCFTDTQLNLDYARAFFDDLDVDWDGDYEFDEPSADSADPVLEQLASSLRDHNLMFGN